MYLIKGTAAVLIRVCETSHTCIYQHSLSWVRRFRDVRNVRLHSEREQPLEYHHYHHMSSLIVSKN